MNFKKLIISILICQAAGFIGSFFTVPSIESWYATINKPSFNPPNWIFAPVWTTLFLLMGIALYRVWNKGIDTKYVKIAITIFGIQLLLNSLWSILFFGMESPLLGLIEIVFLWLAILFSIIYFSKVDKIAAYLLVPYIAWVSFAAILNAAIYMLN